MSEAGKTAAEVDRKWWALCAVCFGLFMALLDVTIVNVALPTIQRDLHTDFSSLEWIMNAYNLVFAVALVTMSRMGDIWGRKRMFIIGLAIFTLGSLLCGLSGNFTIGPWSHVVTLNISRGIQGLGAAAMMPLSLAIISVTFTGKQRGIALGIWGGVSGIATGIGPLIGGVLVTHVSWQSIFLLNVPTGIVAILLAIWAIRPSRDESASRRLDWFGLLVLSVFMFCLIFGLMQINDVSTGWASPGNLLLWGIATVALAVFIIAELKTHSPMIDPRLFMIPSFTGAAVAAFCLSAGMYALLFYLSLYFQNFLGFNAQESGLRFLLFTTLSFVFSPISGILMGKYSSKWLIVVSLVFLAVGVWWMGSISPSDTASDWTRLIPGFILAGIGNGLINPLISNLAVSTVDPKRAGMASGINNVSRQAGSAFGIAFLGAILTNHYTNLITNKLQTLQIDGLTDTMKQKAVEGISEAGPIAGSTGLSSNEHAAVYQHMPGFDTIQEITRSSFVEGTSLIIYTGAIILAIGIVLCALLIRNKDIKH